MEARFVRAGRADAPMQGFAGAEPVPRKLRARQRAQGSTGRTLSRRIRRSTEGAVQGYNPGQRAWPAAEADKPESRSVMNPIFLFSLASRHLQHLTTRQAVISGNIANANTPGYRARDVVPFRDVLDKTALTMAATRAGHLESTGTAARPARATATDGWDVVHSGNSVSIEEQLMKSGEVSREQALNGGVVKAFNRMLALSVKAGQ